MCSIERRRPSGRRRRDGLGLLAGVAAVLLLGPAAVRPVAGWGDRTHPVVNRLAVDALPPKARGYFAPLRERLGALANDPDTVLRARWGRREEIRHFIDLDAFMSPLFTDFPRTFRAAARRFGRHKVERNGVLPWVILRFRRQLAGAIRRGESEEVVREAAYLGHYVADAHQPLHVTIDYDGRRRGAAGLHSRFENGLVDARIERYESWLRERLRVVEAPADEREAVFQALFASYAALDTLYGADAAARAAAPGSKADFDVFEREAGTMVRERLLAAIELLAGLWHKAWINGGRPEVLDPPLSDR